MIISLMGYMGSGKSHIAKLLSLKKGFTLFDLDNEISLQTGMEISEIFAQKGEIFFRKIEKNVLERIIITEKDIVLSLGGGTPCYYDNIDTINKCSESVYLRTTVKTLVERLSIEKIKRPLIAGLTHDKLPEFVAKHLFDRNSYYSQAKYIIDTDGKSVEKITDELISFL